MKILLINPTIREWAAPNCFPSGLGYLAAALTANGYAVEIYDANVVRPTDEEFAAFIKNNDYDLVGVTGLVTIYKKIKEIIITLKKIHPDRLVIAGGSCATSSPHILMKNTPVDFLCIGEGENTIVELVRALENGGDASKVDGLWWRGADGQPVANPPRAIMSDMDSILLPRWDLFDMETYTRNPIGAVNLNKWDDGRATTETPRSMNLISSRGCPYQCTYCYHDFMGAKYRFRSAENIIKEIMFLKEKYNVSYFHFTDDCFIINQKNVLKFCEIIVRDKLDFTWGCAGRVNLMTRELIETMKAAGCTMLCYGIESGSQKILDLCKKKVKADAAHESIKLTQELMGWADCSFIVGLPGETRETIQETIDFCKKADLAPEVIFFATPYPGTELYEIAMQQGKIPDEEAYLLTLGEQGEKVRVNFTDFTDDELKEIKESMVRDLKAWNKFIHDGKN